MRQAHPIPIEKFSFVAPNLYYRKFVNAGEWLLQVKDFVEGQSQSLLQAETAKDVVDGFHFDQVQVQLKDDWIVSGGSGLLVLIIHAQILLKMQLCPSPVVVATQRLCFILICHRFDVRVAHRPAAIAWQLQLLMKLAVTESRCRTSEAAIPQTVIEVHIPLELAATIATYLTEHGDSTDWWCPGTVFRCWEHSQVLVGLCMVTVSLVRTVTNNMRPIADRKGFHNIVVAGPVPNPGGVVRDSVALAKGNRHGWMCGP